MSGHIFAGKTGGGKSFCCTRQVPPALVDSLRNICTNLPLRLDRLNEYMQRRWPHLDVRTLQRVRLLTDSEVRYFWKFRGLDDVAPPELELLEKTLDEDARRPLLKTLDAWAKTPSYGDGGRGVLYILDEAHIPFNARAWASVASSALFYLSQHRKLGDVWMAITQSPGNLDKQFRSVAEDFTYVRNEYIAKLGPFRGRGRFVAKTYLSEAVANSEPFQTTTFKLDELKDCYDTAKGIGVHGNKADIGRRAKGIPIWTVIPLAFGLASLCGLVPWALGHFGGKVVGGMQDKATEVTRVALGAPPVATGLSKPILPFAGPAVSLPVQNGANATEPVFVKGWIIKGTRVNVLLSDGRTLTEGDGLLRQVDRNSVTLIDGTKYWMRAPVWVNRTGSESRGALTAESRLTGSEGAALAGTERGRALQVSSAGTAPSESPPVSAVSTPAPSKSVRSSSFSVAPALPRADGALSRGGTSTVVRLPPVSALPRPVSLRP